MIIPDTWDIVYPWYAIPGTSIETEQQCGILGRICIPYKVYSWYSSSIIPGTQYLVSWYEREYCCAWNPSKARAARCTHRARSDATQDVALSLLHFAQKRILSLTLPPCCHLCPPLHRPEDEGRGYPRRDSRGDRCAFLRRGFLLGPAGHSWCLSHGVLCLLSPSCGRHRQVQIADWSDEVPRTPEELQKLAAEFQASTFIRTHRLFKYVKYLFSASFLHSCAPSRRAAHWHSMFRPSAL